MHPFWLVLKVLDIDNKKDFSLNFETFDVILPNVANEVIENCLLIYYTMSVMLHSTQKHI